MFRVKEFGDWVRGCRLGLGLSLREMSRRLGVSPTYWSMVERGKLGTPPRPVVLDRLASVLGVSRYEVYKLSGRVPGEWVELFFRDRELVREKLGM